jgi:hypothetical protein
MNLLAFKIIAILHNTRLATFLKFLETVSKGLFRNRSQNSCHTFLDCRRTAGSLPHYPLEQLQLQRVISSKLDFVWISQFSVVAPRDWVISSRRFEVLLSFSRLRASKSCGGHLKPLFSYCYKYTYFLPKLSFSFIVSC